MLFALSKPGPARAAVLGIALIASLAGAAEVGGPGAKERPRIGLVLGGGGAKGAAHIGVLRVLEELRIPIDCVAGTSMGALVGATFAAGTLPEDIEREVLAIDWSRTIGGSELRDHMPIDRKLRDQNFSNPLEIGFADGRLRAPGGLLETQDIEAEIRRLVLRAETTENFDDLPIPFRAVATDMVAGEMVVLGEGELPVAMRASMAIPAVFAPVVIGNRVLADGGMMRNLPVDVARDLCADVVIAVWLTEPSPEAADVSSALSVFNRAFDVMIAANERAQIATLTEADIGINVPMGDISTEDFNRVPDAVELGRTAARAQAEALARYSVPEEEYRAWQRSLDGRMPDATSLADVEIKGLDRVNPDYVRASLEDVEPGSVVDSDALAADMERVYGLGDFQDVNYRLTGPTNARTLEITAIEKSWGPDFLRLDFGVSTDGEGDLLGVLRLDHERTWINSRGGRWSNALQVGGNSLLRSDFYQPLDVGQRFFVQPIGQLESDRQDLYFDGDRVARYFVRKLFGQVDLGMNIGTRAQLRLGLQRGWHEADLDTGIPGFPELDRESETSGQMRVFYDTRDAVGLPTRGTFISARYVHADDWLGGETAYQLLEGVVQQAFNFRGNSLSVMVGGANTLSGELPVTQQIQLGGVRTFPGLRQGELRGDGYWFASSSYSWRLVDLQPLLGQALYAGLRIQAGEVRHRWDLVDEGTLYGISGSVSGRTPIGPFQLSLGFVDNGSWLVQFTLGRPIAEGSILDEIQ